MRTGAEWGWARFETAELHLYLKTTTGTDRGGG